MLRKGSGRSGTGAKHRMGRGVSARSTSAGATSSAPATGRANRAAQCAMAMHPRAVRHQHDGRGLRRDRRVQRANPVVEHGRVPIALLHAAEAIRIRAFPQGLPVPGAGILPSGDGQDDRRRIVHIHRR